MIVQTQGRLNFYKLTNGTKGIPAVREILTQSLSSLEIKNLVPHVPCARTLRKIRHELLIGRGTKKVRGEGRQTNKWRRHAWVFRSIIIHFLDTYNNFNKNLRIQTTTTKTQQTLIKSTVKFFFCPLLPLLRAHKRNEGRGSWFKICNGYKIHTMMTMNISYKRTTTKIVCYD